MLRGKNGASKFFMHTNISAGLHQEQEATLKGKIVSDRGNMGRMH